MCSPMDCSLPSSSVHGILQARILEWVATPSSRGSSRPRDLTTSPLSPALAGRFFATGTTWEAHFRSLGKGKRGFWKKLSLYSGRRMQACICHAVWGGQASELGCCNSAASGSGVLGQFFNFPELQLPCLEHEAIIITNSQGCNGEEMASSKSTCHMV